MGRSRVAKSPQRNIGKQSARQGIKVTKSTSKGKGSAPLRSPREEEKAATPPASPAQADEVTDNTPPFEAATQPILTKKGFRSLQMSVSSKDAAFHFSEILNYIQLRPEEHDFRPLKTTPAYRDKEGSKQLWCVHSECKCRATEYCIQCSYRNFAPKIIPVCKTCQTLHKQPGGVLDKS